MLHDENLFRYLQEQYGLSEPLQEELKRRFKSQLLKKRELLVRAGEYVPDYIFVATGALRVYAMTGEARTTLRLIPAGRFLQPRILTTAPFSVEAIRKTGVLRLAVPDYEKLSRQDAAFKKLFTALVEKAEDEQLALCRLLHRRVRRNGCRHCNYCTPN
jgi:CRP-like cAMP-binding protein